jgi:hypothetical protein
MKKKYQKPSMKVYEMKMTNIICQSGDEEQRSPKRHGDEFGYLQTLNDYLFTA